MSPLAISDNESWLEVLQRASLSGPARELAANLRFVAAVDETIQVFLPPSHAYLRSPPMVKALDSALAAAVSRPLKLAFVSAANETRLETLADRSRREAQAREQAARDDFARDPVVRALVNEGASIRTESIRPRDPS